MPDKDIEHIYWFAYYNLDSPSVRYRAKFPLDFAKNKLGISSNLVIPGYSPQNLWHFLRSYISASVFPQKNSLIVIQRVQSNFIYSNLLKILVLLRKEKTVYDIDDADYLEHNPKTIYFFARNCNCISAGSAEIADHLRQFNKKVFHTTSPTPDFGIAKKKRNRIFTIGWIGAFGWGHKNSLHQYLFPALKQLTFDCRLIFVGITLHADKTEVYNYFNNHKNISVIIPDVVDWHDEKHLQYEIKNFDVGIATLLDHPVQLAKSGIKAKQYLNNGVPVICNNLPENNKVVIDGHNGFVCNSIEQFAKSLRKLKEMSDEDYRVFSENAKDSTKHFDHTKWFARLREIKNAT